MNEQECLSRMIPPGGNRPLKGNRGGVIQIHLTRACDKSCYGCTQGSNLAGRPTFMTPEQFEQACVSLKGYWGTLGVFGGNPATSPHFEACCEVLRRHFPKGQCGLWCNNPMGKGAVMRRTFSPALSNLNVHLDRQAYDEFRRDWPESRPFGLDTDSRHSPPYVAMKDVLRKPCPRCQMMREAGLEDDGGSACPDCQGTGQIYDEGRAWELISGCDINQRWSALMGVFRGELRAWFCEVAGAQSMLHQDEPDYPDTGIDPTAEHEVLVRPPGDERLERTVCKWWQLPMSHFAHQVRKHCHECGIPLRRYGELAMAPDDEQHTEAISATHQDIYRPKRKGRRVSLITVDSPNDRHLALSTDYLGNSRR